MKRKTENLVISLLDRLVDHEPVKSQEPVQYRLMGMREIRASVVRDLEHLLNTRQHIFIPPSEYREINNSVYVYGLRDFSSENPKNPFALRKIRQEIEQTISKFEPRLKNAKVHVEPATKGERALSFKITGILVVEPLSEPVAFDTYFDVKRAEYVISK
ncbi:MAG: type VI secretion system baseplate subunit TssE [Desulfosarcina sp.]|nr:type VI secretion system baseplate subunit TssE [Desulfosarcina sp.]